MQHKRLTATGALGTSEDAQVKIHSVQLVADSDGANVIGYKAGSAVAGTQFMELTAGANTEKTREFHGGLQTTEAWWFVMSGTGVQVHVVYE